MCLAGNIPESIDIDIKNLHLGESIRLTEIDLPEVLKFPDFRGNRSDGCLCQCT